MFELKEGQKAEITVTPRTRHGNVAAIEPGSARFTSSDESVVSVEQDPADELKATIRGLDGSANEPVVIAFKADGDRSEGVKEIVGSASVICTQGDALTFDLEISPAVDDEGAGAPQPEPTPAEPGEGGSGEPTPAEPAPAEGSGDPVEPGTTEPAPAEGEPGGTSDPVEPGDPGTATGEPIPAENPNAETTVPTPEGVEAGQPAEVDPSADPKNVDPADRIAAGGPGSVEGDDASPSNEVTGPNSPGGSF